MNLCLSLLTTIKYTKNQSKTTKMAMTCNHVFGKRAGQNEGKQCTVKVTKEGGLCSKHTPKRRALGSKHSIDAINNAYEQNRTHVYINGSKLPLGSKQALDAINIAFGYGC